MSLQTKKSPEHVAILVGPGTRLADAAELSPSLLHAAEKLGVRYLTLCPHPGDSASAQRVVTRTTSGLAVQLVPRTGRADIVEAVRLLAVEVKRGRLHPEAVDLELLKKGLSTAAFPEVDLVIFCRPAADTAQKSQRMPGSLLFELAYAELHFSAATFAMLCEDPTHFELALADFSHRERRFGKTSDQIQQELQSDHHAAARFSPLSDSAVTAP